jgi:hypothetical protein
MEGIALATLPRGDTSESDSDFENSDTESVPWSYSSTSGSKSGGTGRETGEWPKGTTKEDLGNADSGAGLTPSMISRLSKPKDSKSKASDPANYHASSSARGPAFSRSRLLSTPKPSPPINICYFDTDVSPRSTSIRDLVDPPDSTMPIYPIPIPAEKLEKALNLYKIYKVAKYEEELTGEPPNLMVRQDDTLSTDANDGSDFERDMSESDLSKPNAALSTFKGKKTKTRIRPQLSEAARAKTALIRHLGSCLPCRKRRVPVSILFQ